MISRICLLAVACALAAGTAGAASPVAGNSLITFASDRAENYPYPQIYAISATGSKRRRLSRDAAWGPPSWSPNGKAIAFPTIDDVAIASVDGRSQRKLGLPRSFGGGADVVWSPDGRRIALANEVGPLYVKTLGGSLRRFTGGAASLPSWSPNGRLIAYLRGQDPELGVLVVARSRGRARARSLMRRLGTTRPTWSPDGRRLALDDKNDVAVVDVRTAKRTRITRGGRSREPLWSPDGKWIAFLRPAYSDWSEIYVVHPDGTGLRQLTSNRDGISWFTWSPSGHRLAFAGRRTDVYTVDPVTRRIRRLSRTRCGEGATWLTWSPRGDLLAFGAGSNQGTEIFTTDESGARVKRLTRSCFGRKEHPAWSPNGDEIAFDNGLGGRGDIFVVRKDGSGARKLTTTSAREIDPSWSPDGTHLAYASGSEIFTMRAADGTEKRQLTDRGGAGPAWSPRSNKILFSSDRDGPGLYLMNPDGSGVAKLLDGPASQAAWSSDSSRIAYVRDDDIWTMSADGGNPVRLGVGHAYQEASSPSWSPHGTKIVFSADIDPGRGSQYALFTVDSSGGVPQFVAYAPVNSIDPDWQRLP